jgi:YidC/Oxa1 family membrane protein insertase
MEKRVVLAIGLSVLVIVGWNYFAGRQAALLRHSKPVEQRSSEVPPPTTPPSLSPSLPAESPKEVPSAQIPSDTRAEAQATVIEGPLYRAVLENRGATLTSWKLKNYKSVKGELFEMIAPSHSGDSRPYPGSLILGDAALNSQVNNEFYEVKVEEGMESGGVYAPPTTVVLRLRRGSLTVEKKYRFERDNYVANLALTVVQGEKPVETRVLLAQDIGPEHEHLINPAVTLVVVSNRAGKTHRDKPPDHDQVHRIDGETRWVGLDMQYFAIIAIPSRPIYAFEIQKKPVKTTGLDGKELVRNLIPVRIMFPGSSQFRLFLGPKDQEVLESVQGANLAEVIDFGWFSILVRPLLFSLKWINGYVHNYGWSIVILTLLLSLLLFPFRLKQMVSMKKMQAVQPKVKEIQEKYKSYKKTDPRRAEMNQEVMKVYKEHNVNPLGGCLPLLLQMPLLFAFYSLLSAAIELRHAPFFGWIPDLSVKDPYYVLPIIMGVTMFISQKMTPMTPGADPMQAKMMLMMPVIFTVMFLNVSSGLNLYFLCSNIFQIGFQKLTEPWIESKKPAQKTQGVRRRA